MDIYGRYCISRYIELVHGVFYSNLQVVGPTLYLSYTYPHISKPLGLEGPLIGAGKADESLRFSEMAKYLGD
jgi:hypothetical protein